MSTAALALQPTPFASPLSRLDSLRLRVNEVVEAGRKAGPPWATGLQEVDQLLHGGLSRGKVTELTGSMGAGKTALLRPVVARVLASGGWVAWIDARRTLAAQPWTDLGKRMVVIRPREWKRAAWCADLLLRSGVFALVVLDGAPVVAKNIGFRLAQIAREKDAAFVVLSDEEKATRISGTIRLRIEQSRTERTRRLRAHADVQHAQASPPAGRRISLLNTGHFVEVSCAVPSPLARRLCAHSAIPDRRGVARGSRRPWAPKSGSEHAEHQVSWGGRDAARQDVLAPSRIDTAHAPPAVAVRSNDRPVARTLDIAATAAGAQPIDTQPIDPREVERAQREIDRVARQWSRFRKGRRRAAESTYGRPTRREHARERTGASLESHLGQGWGKLVGHGRIEPKPRAPLGRVAEGVG